MRPNKTLALIEISGVDYSSINFPDEFALDGEPFYVPAAIDPQIGDLVNSEERALCQNVLL